MTSLTFSLIVILIATPIWILAVIATASKYEPVPQLVAVGIMCGLTLSVAWGIRLIVLNL